MKTFIYTLLPLSMIWAITSCTAQEDPKPKISSVAYEPCCGLDTMVFHLGDEWVAVPNVFTPNGDGINDLFYPIRSHDSISIAIFRVFDTINDPTNSPVLMYGTQAILYDYLDQLAWKGKKKVDHTLALHKGKFSYYFRAKYKEHYIECRGESCSIVCDEEADIFIDKPNCFFKDQFNAQGQPTSSIPSGEANGTCFGN